MPYLPFPGAIEGASAPLTAAKSQPGDKAQAPGSKDLSQPGGMRALDARLGDRASTAKSPVFTMSATSSGRVNEILVCAQPW